MDLSGSLVMELGNLEGNFGIVEVGLDKQEGVLSSSTARQRSQEQHPGREIKFDKVEGDLGKQETDFGNLGVDFGIVELGRLDKWRQHSNYKDDFIACSKIGRTLGKARNDLGNMMSFWEFSFPV